MLVSELLSLEWWNSTIHNASLRVLLHIICGIILLGCSDETSTYDPKKLPYRLEEALALGANVQTADLNGDGVDEIIKRNWSAISRGGGAILVTTSDGRVMDQANFAGQLTDDVHFLDYDGSGSLEILVPFTRNDSLFVGFVNARGEKLFHFFLIDGEPRMEDEGILPWDPGITNFYVSDIDADGQNELITVVFTAYARLPRGVLAHRLPSGEFVGSNVVGAASTRSFFDDVDGDGVPEVIVATVATNNGAVAGGFDDRHSYLIAFGFDPEPVIRWSREKGGTWIETNVAYDDFDQDGDREIMALATSASSKAKKARFELMEPGTWRVYQHRTFAEPLVQPLVIDLDLDASPDIVAIREPGSLWILNAKFELVNQRRVASKLERIEALPDIDGDGVEEIAAITPDHKLLLLDPDLRAKAVFTVDMTSGAREDKVRGIMRRGIGVQPYLLVDKSAGSMVALELVENRFWWFYRYRSYALWLLGLIAVFGAGLSIRTLHKRNRLWGHIYPAAVNKAANGLLVLDANGNIVFMNTTLCNWLGFDAPRRVEKARYDEVFAWIPELTSFLHEVLTRGPVAHRDEEFGFSHNHQEINIHASAAPMALPNGDRPYWLISFQKGKRDATYLDARAWAMMAKKVTHDIKNPLTNILLTTQRLQTEYRRNTPEQAAVLDPYTERIIERVSSLRRTTKQFMKLLDAEALDLMKTDLNDFVQDAVDEFAEDLPPGVELTCTYQTDLPGARVDRDQMHTVLENLVTNAVNAMPSGGVVTVSTFSVSNLRAPRDRYEPKDYIVLEVQDNGTGMSESHRKRIFEPGFTTSEFGTGLGLVLVQKIVEQHGGFIEVESEEQVGTVFSIHLPVAAS